MISRSSIQSSGHPILPLGEVVQFLDYLRKPIKESERTAGPFPYYGANGLQGTIDKFIFDEPLVLLAEDGGHFDDPDRGIAYRISGKTWVNNHAHVLRPGKRIDLDYLCRVLENYDVSPFITGTTRGKLTQAGASEIPVPVPPLPEQRRIAAILDQVDALRTNRRAALAKVDTLAQSIFIEMFGDTVTNPRKWPVSELGALIQDGLQNGLYKPSNLYGTGTPILRIDGFYAGAVSDLAALKRVKLSPQEVETYGLRANDVVVNRVNSPEYLGKCALIPELAEPTVFESNMMRFSVDETRLHPRYLVVALQGASIRAQILGCAKHAINQSSINQKDVSGFHLQVPPIDYQRRFAKQVSCVEEHILRQQQHHRRLEALFTSLQHRAFRGEL